MRNEKPKGSIEDGVMAEDCISDELLLSYYEGSLTENETETVQRHLNSCHACFQVMASLAKNSLNPPSEEELAECEKAAAIDLEALLAKLLPQPEPTRPNILERLKALLTPKIPTIPYLKPAAAFAAIGLLLILVGRPFYSQWRSNNLAQAGLAYFVKTSQIHSREQPRPTGGFNYEEFGATRNEEVRSRNIPTREKLQVALSLNDKNAKAHQSLATYYLLVENNLKKAREHYQRAYDLNPTNATILNDLGVFAWQEHQYEKAIENLVMALEHEPNLLEAQYNLATLYQTQNKIEEARREWNKYLQIDSTSVWADIARHHLDNLP